MKLALTGYPYNAMAGKTTLARYLEKEHGFYFIDYTGALKDRLAAGLTTALGRYISREDIERDKHRYRKPLQWLGDEFGYNEGEGIEDLLEKWEQDGSPENVVFDCIRFEEQWEVLEGSGLDFVLVGLQIPKEVQKERAHAKGISGDELAEVLSHKSETPVVPEISISGEVDVSYQADMLLRLGGLSRPKRQPTLAESLAAVLSR